MILVTLYGALIVAAIILYRQNKTKELEYSIYFIKGLLLGFAIGSEDEDDAIDGKLEHHFQLTFLFLVFTMTWLEDVKN